MGRHHRGDQDEVTDFEAIMRGWRAGLSAAPAPRAPGDEMICPRCGSSDATVSHGATAHCGNCQRDWQITPRQVRQPSTGAPDAWTAGRPQREQP